MKSPKNNNFGNSASISHMILIPAIPVVVLIFIGLARKSKKNKTPMNADQQRQTDEIITVILPTINNNR